MIIKDIMGRYWGGVSSHSEDCCNCGDPITCYQTNDGSIIEHLQGNGFLLWGPFGMCRHCDEILTAEVHELSRRPK